MMRVPFRQGILRHQTDIFATPVFLQVGIININLIVNETPTLITIADGPANYLFTEAVTVANAWLGPFTPSVDYWLFWDIHVLTGLRTFGTTTVEPVFGPTPPPFPTVGKTWFDTINNVTKVWDGSVFVKKLRVFAAKFAGAATLQTMANPPGFSFTGTQVGLVGNAKAGFIVFDTFGDPIRKGDKTFFTTDDEFIGQIPDGTHIKLENVVVEAVAQQNIPKYRAVQFSAFNEITPAEEITADNVIFGMITEDVLTGDITNVILEGVVENLDWNWSAPNKFVYANAAGVISETFAIPEQVPVGVTIEATKIVLRGSRILLESGLRVNATTTSKGVVKLSVLPVDPFMPIAVGDNDPRMSDCRCPLPLTANLNAQTFRIINLGNPVNPGDSVPLGFADTRYVNITGDVMTGALTLFGPPTLPNHAATKLYVDDTFADVTGDVFSGDIDMNGNDIHNLGVPINPGDAVRKGYVDSTFVMLGGGNALTADLDAGGFLIINLGTPVNLGDSVPLGFADTRYINAAGDTMTGDLVLNNLPTAAGHAVRKSYVDTNFINRDGSVVMIAELTLSGNPLLALSAVPKQYVDNKFVELAGDTMTGILSMGGNTITNVANPANAQDAVTKAFADSTYINAVGDTMVGILSMGGNRITNVANPTDPGDAINLLFANVTYVNVAGDTMTGFLTLNANPTSILHAVTKQYVDNNFLSITMPLPMMANLNMGGFKVTNMADPVSNNDAVNLQYVNTNYINATGDTMTGVLVLNVAPSGPNDAVRKSYVDTNFINRNGSVSMAASLDMGGNTISNLAPPANATDAISRGYADTTYINTLGDTMSGFLTLFADPVNVLHAATKQYVDNTTVATAGDTMTGFLTLVADPSSPLHAATKQYVDNTTVASAGDTMTGTLNMNSNFITNLPTPTLASHASTKAYTDLRVLRTGDTMLGALSMGGFALTGLITPALASDAATKAYVDNRVNKSGDTMTGTLDMNNNPIMNLPAPIAANDAVRKTYVDATFVEVAGDTMNGNLSMGGGFRVTNLPSPTAGTDAVNKDYVDNTTVSLTGDTMTGFLILNANPLTALGAVTKQYVDLNFLLKAGDTMTGDLNMGGTHRVVLLASPVNPGDAVTKSYADTTFVDVSGDTMTGTLNMGTHFITNILDPVSAQDAATKNYVDNSFAIRSWREPVEVNSLLLTIPVGTPTLAIIVDGVSITNGQRVLFSKTTTIAFRNVWIYNQTPGTFSEDTFVETAGDVVYVKQGTSARSIYAFDTTNEWVDERAPSYQEFSAIAAQTVFATSIRTVAKDPLTRKAYLQIYVNGIFQQEGALKQYTVTGAQQITFNAGLTVADDVVIYSFA